MSSCLLTCRTCVIFLIDPIPLVWIRALTVSHLVFTPESQSSYSTLPGLSAHPLFPFISTQRVYYLLPLKTLIIIPFSLAMYFQTDLFHRVLLPSFQVSVHSALTIFETKISPWAHPLQWLDANTKHLHSIFHAIIHLT